MSVYIVNFLQTLKKCLIMTSLKHSTTATTEGNVTDIIYIGKLEIYTVLTYHCATYSVWPIPLVNILYLVLTAKTCVLRLFQDFLTFLAIQPHSLINYPFE